MRSLIITISALAMSGCAVLPAKAQPVTPPPDLSEDLKRVEDELRRTGVEVGKVHELIQNDQLEGIYTLLGEIIDNQREQDQAISELQTTQKTFGVTLKNSEDSMTAKIADAAQWKNTQTIGVGASGLGIVGLGTLAMRKKKGG